MSAIGTMPKRRPPAVSGGFDTKADPASFAFAVAGVYRLDF